jgi:septal ring factor EnvC (AmiA/AmiB activator)
MSDNTDWTLIVRASQQAKVAAEAAVASAKLLESEAGNRLTTIEARLTGIEGRIANIAAGQHSHELAIMRLADTQADHTARLARIEATVTRIEALLADIARRLPAG